MKKITALVLALVMMATMGTLVFADGATREDYKADYTAYKTYYNDVYKPCYYGYNDTLEALAQKIKDTNFETLEQAQRVIDFLNDLKQRKSDFFGDRTTEGKSRYVVPFYRDAMTLAAEEKNYDLAIENCALLLYHVEERVNFLNGLKAEIEEFEVIIETRANGIEWLVGQLNTSGTVAHDYFATRAAGTCLDSEGFNYAPGVNSAMLTATGFNADTDCSWRIIKYKSGAFGIYWSYTNVAELDAGTLIPDVTYLSTAEGVQIDGTSVVIKRNVNVSGGTNANISSISDTAFVAA